MTTSSGTGARSLRTDRLPWTRARATRSWVRVFASLAGARVLLLVLLPAFTALCLAQLVDDVARALLFPALFLVIVLFCERRLLRRPPKPMLAVQLGSFCAGSALHLASLLSLPGLALAATLVLSVSTLLFGSWLLGVLLVPLD